MRLAPHLVSFPDVDSLLRALSDETRREYESEIRGLVERGLPPAVSVRVVAVLFGFSPRFVYRLAHRPNRYYRQFQIKSGKKRRTIEAPKVALKVIQKWIGCHIDRSAHFLDCVYGFRTGKSAIQAAARHCGARWLLELDLQDFFPSITEAQVRQALVVLGYSEHAAHLIASLCCFRGRLPQGSPASPALSNIVFHPVDYAIMQIAERYNATYTRYADDIVLSGKERYPSQLRDTVERCIKEAGFVLNESKAKLVQHPRRMKCYGLLVKDDKVQLTKGYRNKIRAFEHLWTSGKVRSEDRPRIRGHLAYAAAVEKLGRPGGLHA